jgi:hypothetical protein
MSIEILSRLQIFITKSDADPSRNEYLTDGNQEGAVPSGLVLASEETISG